MRNAVLRAHGLPRLQNKEADALADSDVRLLGMSKRVDGDQDMLGFVHRIDLFSVGVAYTKELAGLKDVESRKNSSTRMTTPPKIRNGDTLRERVSWL